MDLEYEMRGKLEDQHKKENHNGKDTCMSVGSDTPPFTVIAKDTSKNYLVEERLSTFSDYIIDNYDWGYECENIRGTLLNPLDSRPPLPPKKQIDQVFKAEKNPALQNVLDVKQFSWEKNAEKNLEEHSFIEELLPKPTEGNISHNLRTSLKLHNNTLLDSPYNKNSRKNHKKKNKNPAMAQTTNHEQKKNTFENAVTELCEKGDSTNLKHESNKKSTMLKSGEVPTVLHSEAYIQHGVLNINVSGKIQMELKDTNSDFLDLPLNIKAKIYNKQKSVTSKLCHADERNLSPPNRNIVNTRRAGPQLRMRKTKDFVSSFVFK